jgi:hypothetical protein
MTTPFSEGAKGRRQAGAAAGDADGQAADRAREPPFLAQIEQSTMVLLGLGRGPLLR